MPSFIDLTGQRFGRLLVVMRSKNQGSSIAWRCQCDCGTQCDIKTDGLRNWGTKSCGCLQRETIGDARRKHGMSQTPVYKNWKGMKSRCLRVTDKNFEFYGGRGITVCEEWVNSFEAFHRDMGDPPEGGTIERKDTSGPYSPDNCVWATRAEQSRNRRSTQWVEVGGVKMTTTEACRRIGINRSSLRDRLASGWDLTEALTTPSRGSGHRRTR